MLSEKKAISKGYILNDSLYITFLKRQNLEMENRIEGGTWRNIKEAPLGQGDRSLSLLW